MRAIPLPDGAGVCRRRRAGKFELDEAYVRHCFRGFLCVCLLFIAAAPGGAQQQPAAAEPGQTPPEGQTQGPVTKLPPPLPPRPPDLQMPDEGRFSIGIFGWQPLGHPIMDAPPLIETDIFGNPVVVPTTSSHIQLQGTPKVAPGFDITLGAGKHHVLRISGYSVKAAGDLTAPNDLLLWGGNYTKGDFLSMNYKFKNVKVSYEFLTWPYPIESRKFRLKTLFQFQYANITSAFDAPLKSTLNGPNTASGHESIYLPTLGLGVAYYVSPKFRLEANGSGFGIPGHSYLMDGDAFASYRVSKVEVRVGFKEYRFRTSLNNPYFLRGNLAGLVVGLRYFLN